VSSPFRADLHCHTTCSDGSLTPTELIARAKEAGLSALAITDHDTVDAYAEATEAAKKAGIILGTGIEFSSYEGKLSVHVLGYNIDLESPELLELCKRHQIRREERNRSILSKLARLGMNLEEKDLVTIGGRVIGRAHIALALVRKGYVNSTQDAFSRYIGDGKPCFDPGAPITLDETLRVIHAAHGKAFLAHPHLLPEGAKARKLLEKPFDGIECFYARCPRDQTHRWVDMARDRHLLISGGSDFHGALKPQIPLGASWVDEATFNAIFTHA